MAEVSISPSKKLSGYQYFVSENFGLSRMHAAQDLGIPFEEVTFNQTIHEVAHKWRELSESGRASWNNFAGGEAEKPPPLNPFSQRPTRGSSREYSVGPDETESQGETFMDDVFTRSTSIVPEVSTKLQMLLISFEPACETASNNVSQYRTRKFVVWSCMKAGGRCLRWLTLFVLVRRCSILTDTV